MANVTKINEPTKRVVLWAAPRTCSTAFMRAISNKPGIKAFNDPFNDAYFFGEERICKRRIDKEPIPNCKYSDIKALYEAPYPGYDAVFVKDLAEQVIDKIPEYMPEGYIHTFLIRNPAKSIRSVYKLSYDGSVPGWEYFLEEDVGFKGLHRMYKYVKENIDDNPIVVDADDLLANPRGILQAYCEKTGLGFDEAMVDWQKPADPKLIGRESGWNDNAIDTKGFNNPPIVYNDNLELPEHILKLIDETKVYYNDLYANRIIV